MKIDEKVHESKKAVISALDRERQQWWRLWQEIADYFMPKRYIWLMAKNNRDRYLAINGKIVDATGTSAGRVLASGMMNGVTSPGRPWFKLRLAGFLDDIDSAGRMWLDEVERRMLLVMAESNFYNCLAIMYIDLVFFGTSSMLIYEDYQSVIRCYNCALGEYYLGQSFRQQVDTFARTFTMNVKQVVQQFGVENCSERVREAYKMGGARLQEEVEVTHLIEPNDKRDGKLRPEFECREYYWETSGQLGDVLGVRGYYEMPGIWPRWELTGNDAYGTAPGLDALGDVKQLQQESIRKGQSLDYMVRPPLQLDIQLQHKPTALLPGGQTYVSGMSQGRTGAAPIYEVRMPIQELTADILDIRNRIQQIFHNDLFRMIADLDTVRSATEIDARREEKLVLLGPVLERFENEALDPAINRIYGIMNRVGLIPEPPESIAGAKLEIQYVSILSKAQSAVGVAPTERLLALIGNIAAVNPNVLNLPNWDELIRDYARDIGVKEKNINTREAVAAMDAEAAKKQETEEALAGIESGAKSAELLSRTEVGGGMNAIQAFLPQ